VDVLQVETAPGAAVDGAPARLDGSSPSVMGDADLAAVAGALADPRRARIVLALADGRALPASVLATEAGIAASTTSSHLGRLVELGLLRVFRQGRFRYYALAGPQVADLVEALARVAPPAPVRSLRQGSRAAALRAARTCYDHLAGALGVAVFQALLNQGWIVGGDGRHHRHGSDRLSSPGRDCAYRLTVDGQQGMAELGVAFPSPEPDGTVALRYCVDWTEQNHHLSGTVGGAMTRRFLTAGWLRRAERGRAVFLTPDGRRVLDERLGVSTSG
jgi:DNA-binding transcriptional ArsR family regulator